MSTRNLILGNKTKFLKLNQEHHFFTQELLDFLGEDFFIAPASPSEDMYNCYPGGLLQHLMRLCKYTLEINNILPENLRIDKNKIMKTVFLSQIGKVFLYKQNESEWHVKNLGKLYEYRDDNVLVLSIGERSVRYATRYGVKLDDDEYQAIINVDKTGKTTLKWKNEILSHILKLGFEMALIEDKNK